MEQNLENPTYLEIETLQGTVIGGSQNWYASRWQRASGCGPTAATNIIWYLARSRPGLGSLLSVEKYDMDSYIKLQTEMFEYVTPGMGGVHNSGLFTKGVLNYGAAHNTKLDAHALDILRLKRPLASEVREFVLEGLQGGCPVAFLNLSHGNQKQLGSWHWVTIIGIGNDLSARISDQGRIIEVSLREWLGTSMLGGAFVFFR